MEKCQNRCGVLVEGWEGSSDLDAIEAELLFLGFFSNGFLPQAMSKSADSLSFASEKTLTAFLPNVIDWCIMNRTDYLIYPLLSVIDPGAVYPGQAKVAQSLIRNSSIGLRRAVCELLESLKQDPPVPDPTLKRIGIEWTCEDNNMS